MKNVLNKVAGSDYDNNIMGAASNLKDPINIFYWAMKYAIMNEDITNKVIKGNPFGFTRKIKSDAKKMYEEISKLIVQRGIVGKVVRKSTALKEID